MGMEADSRSTPGFPAGKIGLLLPDGRNHSLTMNQLPRPLYFDSHMHTPLCKHAEGNPEEYAEIALQRGLKGIVFTCHSPMPDNWWPEVRMDVGQLDEYIALVHRAAETFRGELEIRIEPAP